MREHTRCNASLASHCITCMRQVWASPAHVLLNSKCVCILRMYTHCASSKETRTVVVLATSPNDSRFSKLFYRPTQQLIYTKAKDLATSNSCRYTTVWNIYVQKSPCPRTELSEPSCMQDSAAQSSRWKLFVLVTSALFYDGKISQ